MKCKCIVKDLKISPQKLRLVVDAIRGKMVEDATTALAFSPHKGSKFVLKALKSAAANAEHNLQQDPEHLKVGKIYVDVARTMKRIIPRARGRSDRMIKRSSHLTIVLDSTRGGN
jgi:large subunit ribosomal protein L22